PAGRINKERHVMHHIDLPTQIARANLRLKAGEVTISLEVGFNGKATEEIFIESRRYVKAVRAVVYLEVRLPGPPTIIQAGWVIMAMTVITEYHWRWQVAAVSFRHVIIHPIHKRGDFAVQ